MQITLSAEQVRTLREFIGRINTEHMEAECQPPGYSIVIGFAGPLGCDAVAKCGSQSVDLGEVQVSPEQNNWSPTDGTE
jgi:hypothetical protein